MNPPPMTVTRAPAPASVAFGAEPARIGQRSKEQRVLATVDRKLARPGAGGEQAALEADDGALVERRLAAHRGRAR